MVEAAGHETGIYRSTNHGDVWEQISNLNPRPMYYSQIRIDPKDRNRVYLLGSNRGFYVSDDGGKDFRDVFSTVHSEDHALWIDPDDTNHLIVGGDGGVSISWDRGQTWLFRDNLPIEVLYTVIPVIIARRRHTVLFGRTAAPGAEHRPPVGPVSHAAVLRDNDQVGDDGVERPAGIQLLRAARPDQRFDLGQVSQDHRSLHRVLAVVVVRPARDPVEDHLAGGAEQDDRVEPVVERRLVPHAPLDEE